MNQKLKTQDDIQPSAIPSEDEIRRWQVLPRDEQLSRMRETMQQAVDSGVSDRTMDDIKKDALKRMAVSKDD